jgi:hypothetical protein
MDPVSAAAVASTAGSAGTAASTAAIASAGASSAQAAMLAAQTAGFGAYGTGLTMQALGATTTGSMVAGLGSMSLGTLMSGASLGLNVLSGVQAAGAARTAAAQEAEGLKAQAFQESLKANEESILRRERLLKAISSQAAAAGAGGAAGGSAQALQLESIAAFEREQRAADIMQQTREDIYKRRVAGTLEGGRQAARGELLTTATKLAEIG